MKWTVPVVVLIGAVTGGCATEGVTDQGGDGETVGTVEVAWDDQPTTGDGGGGSSQVREGICKDGLGGDQFPVRIGRVDPALRLFCQVEPFDGEKTDGQPSGVGVVVAKQGARVVLRYPLVRQVLLGAGLVVTTIALVQPNDDGLGPYFLIVYPVGNHSTAYEVVDLRDGMVIHEETGAYEVELLELDTERAMSRSDTYAWDAGRCELNRYRYTTVDFDAGGVTTWEECD